MRTRLLLLLPLLVGRPGEATWDARTLWEAWPSARVSPADPFSLKHKELRAELDRLAATFPGLFSVADEGLSAEGRRIPLLVLGQGPTRVLLWSQMHGDEPTATSALLDVLSFLGRTKGEPDTAALLRRLTLLIIPMLNPDGAERPQRWGAQGIDIDRDALRLQTPEGRFLKAVRDRFQPAIAYNLHDETPLATAGPQGGQVALALLSVPFDEAGTENEGRRTTKRLALFVRDFVAPWASGKVGRYDGGYTARAFGDSMTLSGTPVLLIETGGWSGPDESGTLVCLNFVSLLGSLQALAEGRLSGIDPRAYDAIPLVHRGGLFDLLVRKATVLNGGGLPPYVADVALDRPSRFGGGSGRPPSGVVDLGDLTTFRGKTELAAKGKVLVPAPPGGETAWFSVLHSLRARGLLSPDGEILLDEPALAAEVKRWMEPSGRTLSPGFVGDLLLLRRTGEKSLILEQRVAPR